MRVLAWLGVIALLCVSMGWPTGSLRAQSQPARPRMLWLRSAGDEPVLYRLRAELEPAGWQLHMLEPRVAHSASLADVGRARDAAAVLRVDVAAGRLELWCAGAGASAESLEVLEASDPTTLSLRAVEALRARGLPVAELAPPAQRAPEPGPAPPASPVALRDAAPALGATPSRSVAALEVAPAVSLSPGGMGPAFSALVGARYPLSARLSAGALCLLPLWSEPLRGDEGSARLWPFVFSLGAELQLTRGAPTIALGAFMGVASLHMAGSARAPLRSESETIHSAMLLGRVMVDIPLGAHLQLRLATLLGATTRSLRTRFVEREVAHWGQPVIVPSAGLQLTL